MNIKCKRCKNITSITSYDNEEGVPNKPTTTTYWFRCPNCLTLYECRITIELSVKVLEE